MSTALAVRAIGWKAHAALAGSGGQLRAWSCVGGGSYACVSDEILWVGADEGALHPRAIVLAQPPPTAGHAAVSAEGCAPWRAAALARTDATAQALRRGCSRLQHDVAAIGTPRGFAVMLTGATPAFPLAHAGRHVHALARGFRTDDVSAVRAAAESLLGLGPGLTPAGDDLVGAALFGRLTAGDETEAASHWRGLASELAELVPDRSHPVSAALFADLVAGDSFAALHRLVDALAGQRDAATIVAAAQRLVTIGHSSGWEMLAGLIIGITGSVTALPAPIEDPP
ncbi:MAG: DUF2877 domain-containing protein [Casimicrobiaceae bacterium]